MFLAHLFSIEDKELGHITLHSFTFGNFEDGYSIKLNEICVKCANEYKESKFIIELLSSIGTITNYRQLNPSLPSLSYVFPKVVNKICFNCF